MSNDLKIGIVGGAGRMGQMLVQQVHGTDGCIVAGATEMPGSPAVGKDVGALAGVGDLGVAVLDDPAEMIAAVDAVIDFTAPAATAEHARLAAQAETALIAGTTGLDADQEASVTLAARHVPVVRAPNMSIGVTLLLALTEQVAGILGPESYDIEIVEMHHRHKVDAPSGTALLLGEAAAQGRKIDLSAHSVRSRDGHTGARKEGDIGFATLRGGSVVGDHSVIFAGQSERIEVSHKAESREIFANGAIKAALWAHDQKPGLYSMTDVLGIDDPKN